MIRRIVAVIIAAVCAAAASASAEASYRIEHVYWGNENAANDRIYVRDASTGKRMVLSRHWGSRCERRAVLDYGLGGGCWYRVKESYSTWRREPQGWVSLRRKASHSVSFKHRNNNRHGSRHKHRYGSEPPSKFSQAAKQARSSAVAEIERNMLNLQRTSIAPVSSIDAIGLAAHP